MISVGRWVVAGLFALGGLTQLLAGTAYLTGWIKPSPEVFAAPPGMEDIVLRIAGVVSLFIGALLLVTAWGLQSWRRWARILTVVMCAINLLGLVVLSFTVALPVQAYVSGGLTVAVLLWLFNSDVVAAFAAGGRQP